MHYFPINVNILVHNLAIFYVNLNFSVADENPDNICNQYLAVEIQ